MRIIKLLLIALLAVTGVLYGLTTLGEAFSDSDVPPQIQCPEEILEVSVSDGQETYLTGLSASDKQDGDLTDKIRIRGVSDLLTNDTAKVSYIVFDNDGNAAACSRMIRYTDYEKPHFSLEKALIYTQDEDIQLTDRLSVTDVIDGDISDSIRVSVLAATSDPEVKTVSIQVTNSMGDTARVTLPVVTYSSTDIRPEVVLKEHLVYLKQGSTFQAGQYLSSVSTPKGPGNISEVQIIDTVETGEPGTYYVYYRYMYNYTVGMNILTVVVE